MFLLILKNLLIKQNKLKTFVKKTKWYNIFQPVCVKFRIVICINPDTPIPVPCQIKVFLPPKFTLTLARADGNCVIILATLLKCNINCMEKIECIQLYKQRNQCYSACKFVFDQTHTIHEVLYYKDLYLV